MNRDLTTSGIDRQNILNNPYALRKIQETLELPAIEVDGEQVMTRQQVAELFGVEERTIDRYLSEHPEELRESGYVLMKGNSLRNMILRFGTDMNVGTKTTMLGVFKLRAVLNLAMLLVESDRARALRSKMLDIVIDTIAERSGGHTKYINQRDRDYLPSSFQESQYRKNFTSALNSCVEMNNYKYAYFTDKIYQSIFNENAREYKKALQLEDKEKPRDTMYAEILRLIASFEVGLAHELENERLRLSRKLTKNEAEEVFHKLEGHPLWQPQLMDARTKMASRDLHFRDAIHHQLEDYIRAVPKEDFDKFLGKTSKSLEHQIEETRDVFLRLKDR